jgi:O-antigen ligase
MVARRFSPVLVTLNIGMIVFALSATLSLSASYDPALSRQPMMAIIASVILYLLLSYAARPRPLSRTIAGLGLLAGVAFTGYFVTQFGHQNYPETPGTIQRLGNLTTFGPNLGWLYIHPNAAATLLEVMLPIAVAALIVSRGRLARAFWAGCALAMLYALLLTFSRGAYVGLAGAVALGVVISFLKRSTRRQAMILSAFFALVGVGILIAVIVVAPRIPALASTLGTAESRLELYRNSLFLTRDYAFTGIGLGDTFAMIYSRYSLLIFVPFLTYTHNLLLAVWLGQGLAGIIAFLLVIAMFYIYTARVMIVAQPGALFYGSWMGVTATLLHGLTDARQYTESPWVMPALFFGMALAVASGARALRRIDQEYEKRNVPLPKRSYRLPIVVGAAALLLTVGVGVGYNRQLRAMWYANQGALYETRADAFIAPDMADEQRAELRRLAQEQYRLALDVDASDPSANRRLGNLLVEDEQFADAVPLLEMAATIEQQNPASLKGLGLAYVWTGRTEEAAQVFALLPDPAAMQSELFTWGQFRSGAEQNQPLLGAYAYEAALFMSLDDPNPNLNVWVLAGDTFAQGGDLERARAWYQRVLERDADNQRAQEALARIGD